MSEIVFMCLMRAILKVAHLSTLVPSDRDSYPKTVAFSVMVVCYKKIFCHAYACRERGIVVRGSQYVEFFPNQVIG